VDRNSLFKALAFILGVVLVIELAWGTYKAITISRTDYSTNETVETLDSDQALANVIDSLESNWERRRAYRFRVDQDPLFLGRAVAGFTYYSQGFSEVDEGGSPRLSATVDVTNDKPMAIIKYMGKSYVLNEGDTFGDGYHVENIERQEVRLRKNGKTITLQNQPVGGPVEEVLQGGYRSQEW
jgi:hypothetical protein